MEKNCPNCRYYRAYYKKGMANFYREGKAGLCCQKQKAVGENDVCELYRCRMPTEKTVSVEHIDEVLKDIEELEWIYRDY